MKDAKTDNLFAEKVMKWTHVTSDNFTDTDETVFMFYEKKAVLRGVAYMPQHSVRFDHKFVKWEPTSNIVHAFEVVEKLCESYSNFALYKDKGWGAEFWHIGPKPTALEIRYSGHGSSPEEAICNAVLNLLESTK